jgi:hypothetical protein
VLDISHGAIDGFLRMDVLGTVVTGVTSKNSGVLLNKAIVTNVEAIQFEALRYE